MITEAVKSEQQDLSMVSTSSEFSRSVLELFSRIRPARIIETGTYHGTGTTAIIASCLRDLAIENAVFYSIEVNPWNHAKAVENLTRSGLIGRVRLLNGLSVPRRLLPTLQQIENQCVRHIEFPRVYIDHLPHERAQKYFSETDWPDLPDDLAGRCLVEFDFSPHFILLDSAGSMGNIEFNYVVGKLKSACYIALDDTNHIKHHKSLVQMEKDPRFTIFHCSKERTGFCIAHFDPKREIPADPGFLLSEGERLFAAGRTAEAVQYFEKAFRADPSSIEALNNLGVAAFQLNAPEMAEEFFTRALRLNRRDENGLRNLADLYEARGETHRAEKALAALPGGAPSVGEGYSRILNMKKILVINNIYPPQELGGYGRMMADYVDLLKRRGHQVQVLTSDSRRLGEPGSEPHVDRRLRLFGEWTGSGMVEYERDVILPIVRENHSMVAEWVESFQPDVCVAGNIDLLSALVFSPLFERNVPVLHILGSEFIGYPVSDAPMNSLYHAASPSNWLKEDAIRRGYPFQNAFLVYPGALVRQFEMVFPPATDRLRIAYAGLVNGYKGPQVLIKALDLLNRHGIDFSCSLAGGTFDHEFLAKLRKAVIEMNLEKRVLFTGRLEREGLKDLYARHNVLVFPSLVNETFGISQVEAMAAGLLVITSGKGGAREVVEDGVSGLTFEPGDHRQLAAHLISLAGDRSRWEKIALQGQKRASDRFDIEASVHSLERAIAAILGRSN